MLKFPLDPLPSQAQDGRECTFPHQWLLEGIQEVGAVLPTKSKHSEAFPCSSLAGGGTSHHPLLQTSGGHEFSGVLPIILHGILSSSLPIGMCGSPFLHGGLWESLLTLLLQVPHLSSRDGGKKSKRSIHAANNPTGTSSHCGRLVHPFQHSTSCLAHSASPPCVHTWLFTHGERPLGAGSYKHCSHSSLNPWEPERESQRNWGQGRACTELHAAAATSSETRAEHCSMVK